MFDVVLETIGERMARLKESRSTVHRKLRSGQLKCVRNGRRVLLVREEPVLETWKPWAASDGHLRSSRARAKGGES
jgi:hypothetical protein